MATDDLQRLVAGSEAAPASFKVPGNGQIRPKVVYASFDGSGAAGDFKPCIRIVSDGGEIVGESATDDVVTAGASVDVSWFPRVAGQASSGGSGIQFDTDPQTGDWLHVLTTDNGGDEHNGIELFSTGGPLAFRALGDNVGNNTGDFDFTGSEDFNVQQGGDVNIVTGTSLRYPETGGSIEVTSAQDITVHAAGEADFVSDGEVDIVSARAGGSGDIFINVHSGGTGNIIMLTLPTSDPNVFGALYVDGSFNVKQSQG